MANAEKEGTAADCTRLAGRYSDRPRLGSQRLSPRLGSQRLSPRLGSEKLEIQHPDGSVRIVSGYRFSPVVGAPRYTPQIKPEELPPRVDMRPSLSAVEDQQPTESCTANAVAGAYEYLIKQHRGVVGDQKDVSRLFIYYNARDMERSDAAAAAESVPEATPEVFVSDQGASIAASIDGLKAFGACSERTWPFALERINQRPDPAAYTEASEILVEGAEEVPVDLTVWRQALAEGHPIVFGLRLYKSFDAHRAGKVPMPLPDEGERGEHSGHAMLCVGYSDVDRVFIVRNSWGEIWGDKGYCYIPYDYLMDPRHNPGDSWIIKRLARVHDGEAQAQASWGPAGSILPTIDAELHRMSDEAYARLREALGEVHLESRLALLYMVAAYADGDVSEEELEALSEEVSGLLRQLGSTRGGMAVLMYARRHRGDVRLLEETVEIFGRYLSRGMLAVIIESMRKIVNADGSNSAERAFVDRLIARWEIHQSVELSSGQASERAGGQAGDQASEPSAEPQDGQ